MRSETEESCRQQYLHPQYGLHHLPPPLPKRWRGGCWFPPESLVGDFDDSVLL